MNPTKEAVLRAYNEANDETKKVLTALYGEEYFKPKIPETFDEAREMFLSMNHTDETNKILCGRIGFGGALTPADKLMIIAHVLRGGWVPDYSKIEQDKFFPYFELKSDSRYIFCGVYYDLTHRYTNKPARFALPTKELAEYFGKQFIDIWNDYLTIK